jgi:transketolase
LSSAASQRNERSDALAPSPADAGAVDPVQIAVAARETLQPEGAGVASMSGAEWFAGRDASYREELLPARVRAWASAEAGVAPGRRGFVGDPGERVSLEHFGESADCQTLYQEFGSTAGHVGTAASRTWPGSGPDRLPPRRKELMP